MSDFDAEGFLEWLESIDDYYVEAERVHDEWPEFSEEYSLNGVTMRRDPETNKMLVPVRDYRHAVLYGGPLD